MTKHWCKNCFKAVVDDTASDKFLLMSSGEQKCPSCGQIKPLVMAYFKYGEHTVTDDGKRIVEGVKHLGVNPNYNCWDSYSYPYKDRTVD